MPYASNEELIRRFQAIQANIQEGKYQMFDGTELSDILEARNNPTPPATTTPEPSTGTGTSLNPTTLLAGLAAVALVVTKKRKKS